jgi:SAM-dependent methyltransferase
VLLALVTDPQWGALTAAVYCAVPYLVFTGTPISPRDLHRAVLLRLVLTPWTWWRTLTAPPCKWERRRERPVEEAREWYGSALAQGVGRFFQPRRDDCPWCGSRSLELRVISGDVVQAKPGRFRLEGCRTCGHIFQNPRLNRLGQEFYWRDVYDGLGAESAAHALAAQGRAHLARVEMVATRLALTPHTWLDVGVGQGHFCRIARTVLPGTEFDGLDPGGGVEEAAWRGWLRHPYRGTLTELGGRYDVVSMHRYLEHAPDPAAELDTAIKILPPGGHLLIELPDPESRVGRRLGGHWSGWLQPRNLHLIPIGNLERALAVRGMRIVARERRRAHQRHDLASGVLSALQAFGPLPGRPWAPSPRAARVRSHVRHAVAVTCARPLGAAAALLDRLLMPLIPGPGNTYRVLARKDEG